MNDTNSLTRYSKKINGEGLVLRYLRHVLAVCEHGITSPDEREALAALHAIALDTPRCLKTAYYVETRQDAPCLPCRTI